MSLVTRKYSAFGLVIESDLDLPELVPHMGNEPVNLSIRRAALDRSLPSSADSFSLSTNLQQLDWKAVGRFDIRGTSEIVIDPNPEASDALIRLPLLGSVMALLLSLRKEAVLHASAVSLNGIGVAFLGDKRAGKSTTAGAMVANGGQLVTDDVLAIGADNLRLLPGYPQMKFADDSARYVALNGASRLPPIQFPGYDKVQYQIGKHFSNQIVTPRRFYVLDRSDASMVETIDIPSAFRELMRFSYLNRFGTEALSTGIIPEMMSTFSKLAELGLVRRLTVPNDLARLSEVAAVIEQDLAAG